MTDELGDDLAAFLADRAFVSGTPEGNEQWNAPADADAANRLLRKLRSLFRQSQELHERHRAEVAALDEWLADRTSGIDRETAELERALEGWMRGQHAMTGVVTEHLPAGDLWLRAGKSSVAVDDHAKLAEWLRQHPGFDVKVRAEWKVDKATLLAAVQVGDKLELGDEPDHEWHKARTADGEEVPGVTVRVPVQRSFTIHPRKGEP